MDFKGKVPGKPIGSLNTQHLLDAVQYSLQLSEAEAYANALMYQYRVANALIREKYPGDIPALEADFAERIASIVTKSVTERIDRSLIDAEERLSKKLNDRFDKFSAETDKRFNKMDERFDAIDKRLEKMDERLDNTNKTLDLLTSRVTKLEKTTDDFRNNLRTVNTTLDSLTSRVAKLEETTKTLDASIGGLQNNLGTVNTTLDSLTSRVAKLEETTKTLDASIGDLQNNQGAGVVQQAIANGTATMKEDIRQIKATLNTIGTKLDSVDSRLTQTSRTQRLHLNDTRAASGPWVMIPNKHGKDPTTLSEPLPLLKSDFELGAMTNEQVYRYICFYELDKELEPRPRFRNYNNWLHEYLSERRTDLRKYITNPV
ncbi:hypothetical protein CTheo_4588 [Ceratobasidium theobromae]|uniref:Mug135-like C-terminal domain-containing protein n=1 Tax=Ceratobasidium theobromae TaxID=1582974 RepID=A0A5N5QKJ3_9AGAM|nr:hypothetical protein CTheo_4588 [Ceratobasidium theobromae]